MSNPFQKATKKQAKLRCGLMGPSNSGKTWQALTMANALGKTAVIDTEHGSASKYAGVFEFDTIDITDHNPDNYIRMIVAAEDAGYDAIVIDSLTHAWDWTKEAVNLETIRTKGNSFQIWGKVGQGYNNLMKRIVASKIHVIATMRSKTEYVIEENDRGKKVPKKIGTAPQVREGAEYEFDVVLEMDHEHNVWTVKSRAPGLDGKTWQKPKNEIADILKAWLTDGAPAVVEKAPTIAGSNPEIPRPVNAWTDELKMEAGSYRAEIEKFPGGSDWFNSFWKLNGKCHPTEVLDGLGKKLGELREYKAQAEADAASALEAQMASGASNA